MHKEIESKYGIVTQEMYDNLKRAGVGVGCIPHQRIPSESFVEYVKRNPKPLEVK